MNSTAIIKKMQKVERTAKCLMKFNEIHGAAVSGLPYKFLFKRIVYNTEQVNEI